MTYEDALHYLDGLINYERRSADGFKTIFKLDRLAAFLKTIGNPQETLKIIHVAGTKGKGSTSCFIAQILKQAGFRAGLYTSPHLQDIRERIRILDARDSTQERSVFAGMIPKNDFALLARKFKGALEDFERSSSFDGPLTFFETLTAMALDYFAGQKTDFVVLETGLGGRLDATNVVSSLVQVITPVSYDHEQILGSTLPEIAFEKAGIVKASNTKTPGGFGVCVSAQQFKETMQLLRRRCSSENTMLFEMGRDFNFKRLSDDLLSQKFFYRGLSGRSQFFDIRMLGMHQLVNASAALAAVEALELFGTKIPVGAMTEGLLTACWPGRLEVVSTQPFVILDGAHNRESAARLRAFIQKEFRDFRKWLVFGSSDDKDVAGLAELLGSMADRVILTRAGHPRAADPEKRLKRFFSACEPVLTQSVEEALDFLHKEMRSDEVAVITGSLFVVGEARVLWQR